MVTNSNERQRQGRGGEKREERWEAERGKVGEVGEGRRENECEAVCWGGRFPFIPSTGCVSVLGWFVDRAWPCRDPGSPMPPREHISLQAPPQEGLADHMIGPGTDW